MRSMPSGQRAVGGSVRIDEKFYPLPAFRLHGDRRSVVDNTVELLKAWDTQTGHAASGNIVAVHEDGGLVIYVVPRNKYYSRSPGLMGVVGGLEVLGEFVFSNEAEDRAIDEQKMNFERMWQILRAIRPAGAEHLLPKGLGAFVEQS
jgi:hypothetical protein